MASIAKSAQAAEDKWFATTHWSGVLQAGAGASPESQKALELLCHRYWPPVFTYLRTRGFSPSDAEDLTQSFFVHFLEKRIFRAADRERGRFRSFLLTALKNFLAHEREKSGTIKRGGGLTFLSWEELDEEARAAGEGFAALSPEKVFDRRWALKVFEQAGASLRQQFESPTQARQFDSLKHFLSAEPAPGDYQRIATEFNMTTNAVAAAVRRLRHKFAELVRQQIAETVIRPQDVEVELRHLLEALDE